MTPQDLCLWISLIGIVSSFACYVTAFSKEKRVLIKCGNFLAVVSLLVQIISLILIFKSKSQIAISNLSEFILTVSITLLTVAVISNSIKNAAILPFAATITVMLNLLIVLILNQSSSQLTNLTNMNIHIALFLVSFPLLEASFTLGILYLFVQNLLKQKKQLWILEFVPSLEFVSSINYMAALSGFLFFTAGIITGYLYARSIYSSSAAGWRLDPKIIISTITWFCYLIMCLLGLFSILKGRIFAIASVAAFLLIILTIFTNILPASFHKF